MTSANDKAIIEVDVQLPPERRADALRVAAVKSQPGVASHYAAPTPITRQYLVQRVERARYEMAMLQQVRSALHSVVCLVEAAEGDLQVYSNARDRLVQASQTCQTELRRAMQALQSVARDSTMTERTKAVIKTESGI
jgi:hypothetical protein